MGNKILKKNNPITFESLYEMSGIENVKEINVEPIKQAIIKTCLKSYIRKTNNEKNIFLEKFKNILNISKKKDEKIEDILLTNTNLPIVNIKIIVNYLSCIDLDIDIHCMNFHNISDNNLITHEVLLMIQIPQLKYYEKNLNSKNNCFSLFAQLHVLVSDYVNVKLKFNSLFLANPINYRCEYGGTKIYYFTCDELFHDKSIKSHNCSEENIFFNVFFENFLNIFKSFNK